MIIAMVRNRPRIALALLLLAGAVGAATPTAAQQLPEHWLGDPDPHPPARILALTPSAHPLAIFLAGDSLRLASARIWPAGGQPEAAGQDHTVRNVILGGVIGGAVGILTCTAIGNYIESEGSGIGTCTWKGNLAFGLGGVAAGAIVGWLVS
jgi:hypothetical protein